MSNFECVQPQRIAALGIEIRQLVKNLDLNLYCIENSVTETEQWPEGGFGSFLWSVIIETERGNEDRAQLEFAFQARSIGQVLGLEVDGPHCTSTGTGGFTSGDMARNSLQRHMSTNYFCSWTRLSTSRDVHVNTWQFNS